MEDREVDIDIESADQKSSDHSDSDSDHAKMHMILLATAFLCLLLAAAVLAVSEECAPMQAHLSMIDANNMLAVTWRTRGECKSAAARWSTRAFSDCAAGVPGLVNATATSSTYHAHEVNDDGVAGWTHVVRFDRGVVPGAPLYYCLAGSGSAGAEFSKVFRVRKVPTGQAKRASVGAFRVAVKADEGIDGSDKTIPRVTGMVEQGLVDWVYHVGDISYANDHARHDAHRYEAVWNQYMTEVEPQASIVPYQTAPGNHEYSCSNHKCDTYAKDFTAYRNRFTMPANKMAYANGTNMFFSFDYGNTHFVSISTETDYPGQPFPPHFGPQLAWLEQDLKAASVDPQTKWIVVVGHRPLWCTSVGCSDERGEPKGTYVHIVKAFEHLFHRYGVDLYLAGHVHAYERTAPMLQNAVHGTYHNPTATTYVINGAAGCTEGFTKGWNNPPRPWSKYRNFSEHGFGILDVKSDRELSWTYYSAETGGELDRFSLTRD